MSLTTCSINFQCGGVLDEPNIDPRCGIVSMAVAIGRAKHTRIPFRTAEVVI